MVLEWITGCYEADPYIYIKKKNSKDYLISTKIVKTIALAGLDYINITSLHMQLYCQILPPNNQHTRKPRGVEKEVDKIVREEMRGI